MEAPKLQPKDLPKFIVRFHMKASKKRIKYVYCYNQKELKEALKALWEKCTKSEIFPVSYAGLLEAIPGKRRGAWLTK